MTPRQARTLTVMAPSCDYFDPAEMSCRRRLARAVIGDAEVGPWTRRLSRFEQESLRRDGITAKADESRRRTPG